MDELNKDVESILDMVAGANKEDEKENLAYALSAKTGLDINDSYMFVKTLRLIIENDAVLLDTMLDLIQSIIKKLYVNGALTDKDLEELMKENTEEE